MKSEAEILANVRLRLSEMRAGIYVRYNVGTFLTMDGRPVKIGEPGVSDLIGCTPRIVHPEDVGKTIGVFTALELKQTRGRASDQQVNFINRIKALGGIAGIVRSVEDAEKLVTENNG